MVKEIRKDIAVLENHHQPIDNHISSLSFISVHIQCIFLAFPCGPFLGSSTPPQFFPYFFPFSLCCMIMCISGLLSERVICF